MRFPFLALLIFVCCGYVFAETPEKNLGVYALSPPSAAGAKMVAVRGSDGKAHFIPRLLFRAPSEPSQSLRVSFAIDEDGCSRYVQRMKTDPRGLCRDSTTALDALTMRPLPHESYELNMSQCVQQLREFTSNADPSCMHPLSVEFSMQRYLKEPQKVAVPARDTWTDVTFPIDKRVVGDDFDLKFDLGLPLGEGHPVFSGFKHITFADPSKQ